MIPGEIIVASGEIELNAGRATVTLSVANTGDRPIQVGSHYHFFETNRALAFDRDKARGCRLDIPAGTAVRFEPGQAREVRLVAYDGASNTATLRLEATMGGTYASVPVSKGLPPAALVAGAKILVWTEGTVPARWVVVTVI